MPTIRGFPERPSEYQFIHPVGAILVGYGGSKFGEIEQLGRIAQQRNVRLMLTVFGSSLNADDGTLAILDETRLAMVGFAPPNCQPCHLISEEFLAEDAGAWQYQLVLQTETQQVEVCREEKRPLFNAAAYRRPDQDLNPDLKPKK